MFRGRRGSIPSRTNFVSASASLAVLTLLTFSAANSSASGQERGFPYQAVIETDGEFARSGPGPKYYPTSKLKRGDTVTVHRHDPGGWYMIAPPPGSFSWIQVAYVERTGPDTGVVTSSNVIVRVGSSFGDDREVFQRTLSQGDTVEILAEKSFVSDRGPVAMYQIRPPSHEFRWIAGKALARPESPVEGPIAGRPRGFPGESTPEVADDPFSGPPRISAKELVTNGTKESRPVANSGRAMPQVPADAPPDDPRLEELRRQMETIDKQFAIMIQEDPLKWNLRDIEAGYQQVAAATDHPEFTNQLDQRFAAVDRYLKKQEQFSDLHRLTSEARERDAKLLSMQQQPPTQPADTLGQPFGDTAPANPLPVDGIPPAPATLPAAAPMAPAKFSGAGVLQRTNPVPGLPPYVLVTPEGRVLSYVQPGAGVDLTPWIGRPIGVTGPRGFEQQLKLDLIEVHTVQPVNLRPPGK
jgi:hypothetical protein